MCSTFWPILLKNRLLFNKITSVTASFENIFEHAKLIDSTQPNFDTLKKTNK